MSIIIKGEMLHDSVKSSHLCLDGFILPNAPFEIHCAEFMQQVSGDHIIRPSRIIAYVQKTDRRRSHGKQK